MEGQQLCISEPPFLTFNLNYFEILTYLIQYSGTRQVVYNDKTTMPYTDAVLLETLRVGNLVPGALPHMTEENILVDGKVCIPI